MLRFFPKLYFPKMKFGADFPKNIFSRFPKNIFRFPIFVYFWGWIWGCRKIKGFWHFGFRKFPKNVSQKQNFENYYVMGQNHLSSQGVNPTASKVMYLVIFLWKHRLKCLPSMFSFHGK